MELTMAIQRLEKNQKIFEGLLEGLSGEAIRFRTAPGKWNLLEIVNHLVDEEREDFRQRIDLTLHAPDKDWPPIDPEGWVKQRSYESRDYAESLDLFFAERQRSLNWLRSLKDPAWDTEHAHRSVGKLRAGDLLASWLAHDLLHTRQILRVHWALQQQLCQPFRTEYAGAW